MPASIGSVGGVGIPGVGSLNFGIAIPPITFVRPIDPVDLVAATTPVETASAEIFFESLLSVSSGIQAFVEMLLAVSSGNTINAESLLALAQSNQLAIENLQSASSGSQIVAEMLAALSDSNQCAFENLLLLSNANQLSAEDLLALSNAGQLSAEDLLALSQSSQLSIEDLLALSTSGQLSAENLSALTNAYQIFFESLLQVVATGLVPFESGLSVSDGTEIFWEAAGATATPVSGQSTISFESLLSLSRTSLFTCESLLAAISNLIISYESLLVLNVGGVIATDYLSAFSESTSLVVENLLSVSRSILASLEQKGGTKSEPVLALENLAVVKIETTASDDFNRADTTSDLNPDLNGSWITNTASINTPRIQNNQLETGLDDFLSGESLMYRPTNTGISQFSQLEYASATSGRGGPAVHILTSGGFGNATAYIAQYDSSLHVIQLMKCVNRNLGSSGSVGLTQLGADYPVTLVPGDIIRIQIDGTTLKVFLNNVLIIGPQVDSTITSGRIGVIYSKGTGTIYWDNWSGGDLVATGTQQNIESLLSLTTSGQEFVESALAVVLSAIARLEMEIKTSVSNQSEISPEWTSLAKYITKLIKLRSTLRDLNNRTKDRSSMKPEFRNTNLESEEQ